MTVPYLNRHLFADHWLRKREAIVAVIDQMLYYLYGLSDDEISIVEGNNSAIQCANNTVSYGKQRTQLGAAGGGEQHLAQEAQSRKHRARCA